jgi:outer membrane protein assembly factor BamB
MLSTRVPTLESTDFLPQTRHRSRPIVPASARLGRLSWWPGRLSWTRILGTTSTLWLLLGLASIPMGTMAWAEDWNQFRGPRTNGTANAGTLPSEWGPEKNVRWKVPLPQPGNGSPIVVGDRVFLALTEDDEGTERALYCFDRATGERLWSQTVVHSAESPTHETNPHGSSTPAASGDRVVVWHASAGLHCYTLDGQPVWSRNLGTYEHMWGYGTSPIIHGDRVLMHCSPGKQAKMVALSLETGEILWQVEEPQEGDGERNPAGNYMGSWATPVVTTVLGQDQIICSHPTRVVSYDPETGERLWWCEGLRGERGDLAYSSPMTDGKICIVAGGFQGPSFALRLDEARGNLTDTHRLWRAAQVPQSIGTGILLDDVYYMAHAGPAVIECLEAATGKSLWRERGGNANHWGSVVQADGRLWVTNQEGTTLVFRPHRERLDLLATNRLGEPSNSTPAISPDALFIRTFAHLYCIAAE